MPDYEKIWGTNSSLTPYEFSDSEYLKGWESVGNTPPARQMFDALQQLNDLKTKNLNDRMSPLENNANRDYRQPNETVTAGTIRYHQSLPTGYYLECTTEGTTSAGEITPSSTIGDTVTDGTVTWIIRNIKNTYMQPLLTTGDIDELRENGLYHFFVNPSPFDGGNSAGGDITVFKSNYSSNVRCLQVAYLTAGNTIPGIFFRLGENENWTAWRQQEAIVAKSLGQNGYIKYASGLIVQWGNTSYTNNPKSVTFPIEFANMCNGVQLTAGAQSQDINLALVQIGELNKTGFKAWLNSSSTASYRTLYWFAIGY